jgi:hypothetical protein
MRVATLVLLVGGLACAKNRPNEEVGAARDSTAATDSAKANQSKSGVTDTKTGKSTLGPGATKTRPDQGQPVTSKGDTINPAVDSSANRAADTSTHKWADSSANGAADSSANRAADSSTTQKY